MAPPFLAGQPPEPHRRRGPFLAVLTSETGEHFFERGERKRERGMREMRGIRVYNPYIPLKTRDPLPMNPSRFRLF